MLGDLESAYLGVEAPDTAAFGKIPRGRRGLVPGDDPDTWRNDRKARRVIVTDGPSADATFLGFAAAGPDVWTATVNQLESAGYSVGLATTAFDASHRFVTEGLGLRQTDWVETEIAAGVELEIRFYQCNPRHHSLALARARFDLPQQLHHFMVEVADRDDVGYAFDRAWRAGCTRASGLGQHPNDQMSAARSHRRPASRSRSATAPGW